MKLRASSFVDELSNKFTSTSGSGVVGGPVLHGTNNNADYNPGATIQSN